jgi:hypothetical protein
MKLREMEWHSIQIKKVRGQLNAPDTPINLIVKPLNMRSVVFNRRISRLRRHERDFEAKLEESLLQWFHSRY